MALNFTITYLERKNQHYIIGINYERFNGLYEVFTNGGISWNKHSTNPGFMIWDHNNCIPNGEADEIVLKVRGTNTRTRELEKSIEIELNVFMRNQ